MGIMTFRSLAFDAGDALPVRFSRNGANTSPSFMWRHVYRNARTLLIAAFARGPGGGERVLWLTYNILPFITPRIGEGEVPPTGTVGINSDGVTGYSGPPDTAGQTIEFRIYALRGEIEGAHPLTWAEVAPQVAQLQILRPASTTAYFPAAPVREGIIAGHTFTSLGPYLKYSEDPRIRDGIVYAGRDRAVPDRFGTIAALWQNGWTLLPDPRPGLRRTLAQNGRGAFVVGFSLGGAANAQLRPCLWDLSGSTWSAKELPLPAGASAASANDISADGSMIIGQSTSTTGAGAPTLWSRTATGWDTEILPDAGLRGEASDIAEDGSLIAGSTVTANGWRAARWSRGCDAWQLTLLDTPGAGASSWSESHSDGLTVGSYSNGTSVSQATMWNSAGQRTDLGVSVHSEAQDHHSGIIVGADRDFSDGQPRAFRWAQQAGSHSLHPPGWNWSFAGGIDGMGRIVGTRGMGIYGGTAAQTELFLAVPTPP